MTVRDYSTTPGSNNAAPPNGWPEGQAASTVNDCGRQMMAEIRETFEELPYFDWGDDPTRVDNDTFTLSGDLTARYPVGARVKLVGATTGTGRITVSSHAAGTTTIDVVMDAGNVPTSLVRVAVAPAPVASSTATPAAVTLSASAGTASAVSRSDHVHAVDQSIAPTWTAQHTFTNSGLFSTNSNSVHFSAAIPLAQWTQTDAATNNKRWAMYAVGEKFNGAIINDAGNASALWMTVDRTDTTVDRVAFPTDGNASQFSVGVAPATTGSLAHISTASTSAFTAKNTAAASPTMFVWNTATAGDNVFISFLTEGSSGTARGSVDFNRAATQVRYNVTCDRELKDAIEDSGSAIAALLGIPVRTYRWKETGYTISFGFVAQEVELVFPEAVSPGGDGRPWGMDYSKMVPVLTKALQEVVGMCQQLAARVAALEAGGVGAIGK